MSKRNGIPTLAATDPQLGAAVLATIYYHLLIAITDLARHRSR